MSEHDLDYRQMMRRALMRLVREALELIAEHGMPGKHHVFLSFRTDDESVVVPSFLRNSYPEEMTVVIQNQYWDLFVDDDGVSVTLAFGGSRHRIGLSWDAITAFVDPEADFALRFTDENEDTSANTILAAVEASSESTDDPDDPDDPETGGDNENVVSIDRFRKK